MWVTGVQTCALPISPDSGRRRDVSGEDGRRSIAFGGGGGREGMVSAAARVRFDSLPRRREQAVTNQRCLRWSSVLSLPYVIPPNPSRQSSCLLPDFRTSNCMRGTVTPPMELGRWISISPQSKWMSSFSDLSKNLFESKQSLQFLRSSVGVGWCVSIHQLLILQARMLSQKSHGMYTSLVWID